MLLTKADKRRRKVCDAERTLAALDAELKVLERANRALRQRDLVLCQMIDGLGAVAAGLAAYHAQEVAPSVAAAAAAAASCREAGSAPPALADLSAVRARELEIQAALQLLNGMSGQGAQSSGHWGTAVLKPLLDRARVATVLSMSIEDIIRRLRELAGKTAIMLLQNGQAGAGWFQLPAGVELSRQPCNNGSSSSSSSSSSTSTGTARSPGAAEDGAAEDGGAACLGEGGSGGPEPDELCPALEFMWLVMAVMLWDQERFDGVHSTNLETGEPLAALPDSFWRRAAARLELSQDQVATFLCMHQLLHPAWLALRQEMEQSAQRLVDSTEQQLQQVQVEAREPLAALSSSGGGRGPQLQQLHAAQEEGLRCHVKQLARWKALSLAKGFVAINTLSPRQIALFVAASFPSIPRIDLITNALAEDTSAGARSGSPMACTSGRSARVAATAPGPCDGSPMLGASGRSR